MVINEMSGAPTPREPGEDMLSGVKAVLTNMDDASVALRVIALHLDQERSRE
jgi:hypothetical protein